VEMGRLEEIIERNKHPGKHRKGRFPLGIGVALFVLIILVLMIFTDLDESPDAKRDTPQAEPAPASRDKHVNGIMLYKERPKAPRDAAVPQPAP
jgi:hypothetical protein